MCGVNASEDASVVVEYDCGLFADGGVGCAVCVSLSDNWLGVKGGAAIVGTVQHLTSLTTLEYV
jgi:hypothetical protein